MRLMTGLIAALIASTCAYAIPGVTIPFPDDEDTDAETVEDSVASDEPASVAVAPPPQIQTRAITAGPHLDAAAYPAGDYPDGSVTRLVWTVQRETMDGTAIEEASERILLVGPDFAHDGGGDAPILYDFGQARRLTLDLDARTMRNESFYGDIRQRLDTYLGLSQGGTLADIPYGPDRTFDRFWLEAAMGMRRQAEPLQVRTTDGITQVNRDGVAIFAFASNRTDSGDVVLDLDHSTPVETAPDAEPVGEDTDPLLDLLRTDAPEDDVSGAPAAENIPENTPSSEGAFNADQQAQLAAHADLFRRWMRHALPVHPDALSTMDGLDTIPARFELVIVSPASPEGRREVWSLEQVETAPSAFPLPDDLTPAYPGPEALAQRVVPAAVSEITRTGDTDHSAAMLAEAAAYRAEGNLPAAYLAVYQDSAHAGSCTPQTSERPTCAATSRIISAGLGNAQFEAFFEGIAAIATGDYALAIQGVGPYLDLGGYAGAAANTIAANELIAWAASGGEPPDDHDPFVLLATAIENDPGAPAAYWHLGQALITTGDRNAGWTVYDLGRVIDTAPRHPLLQQSYILEDRLRALAPDFFLPR